MRRVSEAFDFDFWVRRLVTEGPQVATGVGACLVLFKCQEMRSTLMRNGYGAYDVARYWLQKAVEVLSYCLITL